MNSEIKRCQNCKKDFTIEIEDFNFYEKIKVPPPTWCPECRMIRRWSCINGWSVFYDNCDKCGIRILSMYSPSRKITIYCQPCWWADDWDGTEYAMDYDPTQPFLAQLKELTEKTPYMALESTYLTVKNSDYSNEIAYSKNCYRVTWADYCEDVYYSSILNGLKWSSDCLRGFKSELCYGSIGFSRNYQTFFSDECDDCVDVWFSRNCYGCSNCIGCVNLRGVSYQIFNVQYTKGDYAKKLKELSFDSWKNLREFEARAHKFWLEKPYREYNGHSRNLNVTGDHIYDAKNSKECYIVNGTENCKYTQMITVPTAKDSMDYSGWGNNAELIYDSVQTGDNASNIKLSVQCVKDVANIEYSFWIISGKNNFGCVNLKRKAYCILNKQYSKEEYKKLKEKIIHNMQINVYVDNQGHHWNYGELFSEGFCKLAYNNSNAMRFFPKTKEQALKEGYTWDDAENPIHSTTIKSEDLPDTITETTSSVLSEVIECIECNRGYKIVKGELDLLRKMSLPVPHECPKCRENKRFARMTKPVMHHRNCNKCGIEIYTPYAPEDLRIVYCVKDYQAEFA